MYLRPSEGIPPRGFPDCDRQSLQVTIAACLADMRPSSFATQGRLFGRFCAWRTTAIVFHMITTWNFVACSAGRSAGFAPLMILST